MGYLLYSLIFLVLVSGTGTKTHCLAVLEKIESKEI